MKKIKSRRLAAGTPFLALLLLLATGWNDEARAQVNDSRQVQENVMQRAHDLFAKQKYAAAQQLYDEVSGQMSVVSGRWDDYKGNFITVSDAAYFAAVCSAVLDNEDAAYRLEEFLRLYPQSSRCNMARFYQGNFYYARGDYGRALSYYRSVDAAEVEHGHRAEYDFKMGYCYFQKGDTRHAAECFARQVNGLSKYRNSSLYYYAHIQYMNGEYDLALRNFKELANDRKFADIAPSYIARIYYYLGRYDELLEIAPSLLADKNAFRKNEVRQMVGEVYFNRGEYRKAVAQYHEVNEAARQDPSDCTPQDNNYQIGYSYYMLGEYPQAATYLAQKTVCDDSVAQQALYILGDCYVKLDRKDEARSMFLQAGKMNYDPVVKEDAQFNYAKLCCEQGRNAYNESIRAMETYLNSYPRSRHLTEAQEILTELYCSTNNYKEAIRLLDQVPDRSAALNQAFQRALLCRGIELCNSDKEDEGEVLYERAIRVGALPRLTADANYLLGEMRYRQKRYDEAEKLLNKFLLSSYSKTSTYADEARYTYAYLLLHKKCYGEAEETFSDLYKRLSSPGKNKETMLYDVCNRIGDCRYVQSQFAQCITMYDKVIAAGAKDADYATFQKALAYGAMGRNSEKLTYLNYIFERYEASPLKSKAMLEIANTYMMCDNNEMAMTYYSNFVKQYPKSRYVKTALLNQGLIYYNTERPNEALETFDRLLTQYPGSDESRNALRTVKNIYVDQNRVSDYFDYVQRTINLTISSGEQDSTTFLAAEGRYQEGDFQKAATSLDTYIKRFPKGLFTIKAHYLAADSYMRLGDSSAALPHYEAVAAAPKGRYTETALQQAAKLTFAKGDYNKAAAYYHRMTEEAESDNGLIEGRVGALRCAVIQGENNAIMQAAQALAAETKATHQMHEEAYLAMARSTFDRGMYDSAAHHYARLTHSSNGELSGEARCRQAEILILNHDYDAAERIIERAVNDLSSDYWLAYSFILWADIYYVRGNNLQAKQTLQSIIDNYDGQQLLEVAKAKLQAIVASEQVAPAADDDELIIEM